MKRASTSKRFGTPAQRAELSHAAALLALVLGCDGTHDEFVEEPNATQETSATANTAEINAVAEGPTRDEQTRAITAFLDGPAAELPVEVVPLLGATLDQVDAALREANRSETLWRESTGAEASLRLSPPEAHVQCALSMRLREERIASYAVHVDAGYARHLSIDTDRVRRVLDARWGSAQEIDVPRENDPLFDESFVGMFRYDASGRMLLLLLWTDKLELDVHPASSAPRAFRRGGRSHIPLR
ncbi:MAG: hypothetical protein AAGE52_11500 [Myxococcota bacterium]